MTHMPLAPGVNGSVDFSVYSQNARNTCCWSEGSCGGGELGITIEIHRIEVTRPCFSRPARK